MLILPENIQIYVLPIVGWGCYSLGNRIQGCATVFIFSFLLGIIYLCFGAYPKSFRNVIDPLSMAIGFLLFFETCAGVVLALELNRLSYTYFIMASLVIALGIYLIILKFEKNIYKHYKRKLNSVEKFEDLHIKNSSVFQKYLCVAYNTHHKFLLDGTMIKYACDKFHDIHTYHMLLRLALTLPLDTPNLDLIEINASAIIMSYTTLAYSIFEYKTVQAWRQDFMDALSAENIITTNKFVKNFTKIAFSYASFIQREGSKSSFVFGQALSEIATILQSHIDRWLLFHPTRTQVLKTAAYFYEHCFLDKGKARELTQQINLYDYFTMLLPNWREIQTIKKYPIDLSKYENIVETGQTNNVPPSEDVTDSTAQTDKLLANDIVYSETRSCLNINFVIILLCLAGLIPFITMIYLTCRSYQKDFRALVLMTDYWSQHVYYVVGMIVYGLEPGYDTNFTSEDRSHVSKFINEFAVAYSTYYTKIMLLLNYYRNLNRTCSHLYTTQYFPSRTLAGSPRFYNFASMMRKILASVKEAYPDQSSNRSTIEETNFVVEMFTNASDYFAIFLQDYYKCLDDSYEVSKSDIYYWSYTWGSIILVVCFLILLFCCYMNWILRKMNESFNKIDSSNASRLMEVNLSQRYHSVSYYISMILIFSFMVFIVIVVSLIANRLIMLELQKTTQEVTTNDLTDIGLMGVIGTALSSLEISNMSVNVSRYQLIKNIVAVTSIWFPNDEKWGYNNESSNALYDIMVSVMNQMNGLTIEYNRTKNQIARHEYNERLRPMFKERVDNRTLKYYEKSKYVSIINGQLQAILFSTITLLFFVIGVLIVSFTKSVIFTEFILKLIPYVHQQTDTNTQDALRVASSYDSRLLLDILGVPGALIDENNLILYVNHEWMTIFTGTQSTFVGINYQIYAGRDPDIVIYDTFENNRIVSIGRSKRIMKLRKQINLMEEEYEKLNQSTKPNNVLTEEQKDKKVVCASLSVISYNLQNEDIDLIRNFTDLLFNLISQEMENLEDAKLFMWSYSDITIAFGFDSDNLILSALQAIHLISVCTQFIIETEDFYGLYCSSSLMIGKIDEKFDGTKCRSWRIPNSITLSADVAGLISNYIADMTYILDNDIAIIILEGTDDEDEDSDY
ncbi:hypothetical protein TVAG_309140 [Trichomonas vaginalis G3]|uniref:Uncharacterized protein n=1 Tax=Trichomonas vaginalis (strain ATCC PRA-98 / G3) TaxID=412133 RepID=A2EDR0_TRIV3|nr:hypothetical protein TVAGG3_0944910 [Trichomonas vaginalis G3]EAY09225.1 hypothetical protein TVAG_309140 [Trichomonas vaginalis G3]KAI5486806.1 hypothetical protein TVAGG3_0944910 [Trichomonas vaginalis G3]|eukprot:XP_001321448.1 hypothetical protein [Trichomonas vaginalis G3]